MNFIKTLIVIAVIIIIFQFFVWSLPYIAIIALLYWGTKGINNKISSFKEEKRRTSDSEVYTINNDNMIDKEIVDVEYEDVQ